MQICNESTEEERVDNIEKESADSEENREAKQLPYWPNYKLASDIKPSSLFKEPNKILTLLKKN